MRLSKKRMLELLELRKMKLGGLAVMLGISQSFMSQVLSGRKKLSIKRCIRLIQLFGANDISYVIDWEAMKIKNPLETVV